MPQPSEPRPLLGTELEYGIAAPGRPDLDADALAALVVDHAAVPATTPVSDTHNRTLGNGGRLYVDHGHPEYATPEVRSASDIVLYEAAGDALLAEAAASASAALGAPVTLYRNNTDGKGHSYGYHENLLVSRAVAWSALEAALPAVLVTRTLFAGAGRVGLGQRSEDAGFQLSQRADFFVLTTSLDTTRDRGLVNTRDEPHARPSRWRRLHVITGDARRSTFATWLSVGTLGLCVAALEEGLLPTLTLANPTAAFRTVSRDPTCTAPLPLTDGSATAIDIQERLADAAGRLLYRREFIEGEALLHAWIDVLDALRRDPATLADRIDWIAKRTLLDALRARDQLDWSDPKLTALDLAWASLTPGGIVDTVRTAGRLVPPPDADAVRHATAHPPHDTRAAVRGRWIGQHPEAVLAATWDSLLLRDDRGALHTLGLPDPFAAGVSSPAPTDRAASASIATLIRAEQQALAQGGSR
ncbi:proteasome accessory factor PafA2 family protein [Propioniciclava soli]|uniref:Proteasome accessory factor PafA2 family protein n=1 Tax=Propioniciclava soli TaxID=2775081 RepID=A0ABZ3C3P6_9ACTN